MKYLPSVFSAEGALFFGPGWPCIEKLLSTCRVRLVLYCPFNALTLMRDLSSAISFFSIAAGISILFGAAIIDIKPPAKDALAYHKCIQLHPERYCGITYLGKQ